jgi:hypothetical protein
MNYMSEEQTSIMTMLAFESPESIFSVDLQNFTTTDALMVINIFDWHSKKVPLFIILITNFSHWSNLFQDILSLDA